MGRPTDSIVTERGSSGKRGGRGSHAARSNRRAQLVLSAAVVIVVALVPIVLASLQLGYHADVDASGEYEDPSGDALAALERAVHAATADVPASFAWTERDAAATAVRDRLADHADAIESARIAGGTAHAVSANATAATAHAATSCPSGPDRQFGDCEGDGGLVLQERAGRTHVPAVALDVTTTTARGETHVTAILRPRANGTSR